MKKILIVDDSPTARSYLDNVLAGLGYHVTAASGGEEACEMLTESDFNMIITDMTMPGMDGITFVRHVKKQPNCKFVPVVMLSSERNEYLVAEAKRAGASTFLSKPIKEAQLAGLLNVIVGRPSAASA